MRKSSSKNNSGADCKSAPAKPTFGKGEASFYLYDHLGNTRVTYTPTGFITHPNDPTDCVNEVNSVVNYFPYGKVLREFVNGDQERYLTTQHERDQETGLDYRGARYYDGDVGRFLSTDPWQDKYPAWSTYNYVMVNPLMFTDPTGKGVDGDYYDVDGGYIGTDDKDDGKVYVADSDGNGGYENAQELDITKSDFEYVAGVIRKEASGIGAKETLGVAHALNNQASKKGRSLSEQISKYSTVPNKKSISKLDKSNASNYARAGLINVLSGGIDITGGATHWDGVDFLAWGLDARNGGSHNKFKEYVSISIAGDVFLNYASNIMEHYGSSVRYPGKGSFSLPASVFKDDKNWTGGSFMYGDFNYVTGSKKGRGNLISTSSIGETIFWKIVY